MPHFAVDRPPFLTSLPFSLRAIARSLLATGPCGTTTAFTGIARGRLQQTGLRSLPPTSTVFASVPTDAERATPTPAFWDTLSRARCLFGLGLAFESLPILSALVNAAESFKFDTDTEFEEALFVLDGDIAQALQSCKEQNASGRCDAPEAKAAARASLAQLRDVLGNYESSVEAWGGEFPLERSEMVLARMKL